MRHKLKFLVFRILKGKIKMNEIVINRTKAVQHNPYAIRLLEKYKEVVLEEINPDTIALDIIDEYKRYCFDTVVFYNDNCSIKHIVILLNYLVADWNHILSEIYELVIPTKMKENKIIEMAFDGIGCKYLNDIIEMTGKTLTIKVVNGFVTEIAGDTRDIHEVLSSVSVAMAVPGHELYKQDVVK